MSPLRTFTPISWACGVCTGKKEGTRTHKDPDPHLPRLPLHLTHAHRVQIPRRRVHRRDVDVHLVRRVEALVLRHDNAPRAPHATGEHVQDVGGEREVEGGERAGAVAVPAWYQGPFEAFEYAAVGCDGRGGAPFRIVLSSVVNVCVCVCIFVRYLGIGVLV